MRQARVPGTRLLTRALAAGGIAAAVCACGGRGPTTITMTVSSSYSWSSTTTETSTTSSQTQADSATTGWELFDTRPSEAPPGSRIGPG